jgi:hypothetical protein
MKRRVLSTIIVGLLCCTTLLMFAPRALSDPDVHDVAVEDVTPSRGWVFQGKTVDVNVTSTNLGDVAETVTVNVYYNGTPGNGPIGTQVVALTPSETQTLTFTWNTAGVPIYYSGYNITAVADISPETDDNLTNNVLQSPSTIAVRIFGDMNGDSKVDVGDVAIVAQAFGSNPTRPRWDPDADLNGDGIIDVTDIALVAKNFGKHYP